MCAVSCDVEQKPKKSRDDEDKAEEASKTFFFVISLKRPIHQGQQRYSHLVLQTTDANGDITSPIAEVRGHLAGICSSEGKGRERPRQGRE